MPYSTRPSQYKDSRDRQCAGQVPLTCNEPCVLDKHRMLPCNIQEAIICIPFPFLLEKCCTSKISECPNFWLNAYPGRTTADQMSKPCGLYGQVDQHDRPGCCFSEQTSPVTAESMCASGPHCLSHPQKMCFTNYA